MNRHMQSMQPTEPAPAQAPSPPCWQSDRRSDRNAGARADGELERRSGVDNRRQPRMPAPRRPIYPD